MRKLLAIGIACLLLGMALGLPAQQRSRKVSVQGLIYDLQHPDPERRVEAARLLGNNKIRQAVPALMAATTASETEVRLAALDALDQIRDTRAQPVYVRLTADPDPTIRRKAIDALVHLYVLDESGFIAGTKKVLKFLNPFDSNYNELVVESYITIPDSVIAALTARLDDPEDSVRKAAVMSLGIFRARSALGALETGLGKETENDIKIEYIRTFYKIADPAACPAILPFVNDPEKSVHDEAILTSGMLRCSDAVPALMDIYESGIKERKKVLGIIPASSSDDLQLKCLQSLARIGDPRSEKLFIPALRHENAAFRLAGAEGLARIANPKTLPLIERQRRVTKDRQVLLALDYALYRMNRPEYLNEMVSELDSSRYGDQVFGYLIELPPDRQADLFPLLRMHTGKVRIRLLDILGLIGGEPALEVVQTYTNDSDADVASAALLAVRRIRSRIG